MNNHPSAANPSQEPECTVTQALEQRLTSTAEAPQKSLAAYMEESYTAADFLEYIRSIAAVLEAMHKKGALCLNVCPGSILCHEDGTASLSASCPNTHKEAFLHADRTQWKLPQNRDYAAPEITVFTGGYFDRRLMVCWGHRADIYSLGLILCQALFGCQTMTRQLRQRILDSLRRPLHKDALATPWQDIPDAAVEELRLLLNNMLTKLCADRMDTMGQVVYEISCILSRLEHSSETKPAT